MGELRESIKRLLEKKSGLSDREITDEIRGRRALQQNVNQACRSLKSQGVISREKREDGIIGNYLTGKNRLLYQRQEPQVPRMIDRKCMFCKGTGIDQGRGIADVTGEKCRVCEKSKRKGFNKVPEYYIKCKGKCKGTGRIRREPAWPFPNYDPCPICEGTGWADPRMFE